VYKAVDNAPKKLRADLTKVKPTRRYLDVFFITL
jgi:ribosome-associated translation inhibitor RaiA